MKNERNYIAFKKWEYEVELQIILEVLRKQHRKVDETKKSKKRKKC